MFLRVRMHSGSVRASRRGRRRNVLTEKRCGAQAYARATALVADHIRMRARARVAVIRRVGDARATRKRARWRASCFFFGLLLAPRSTHAYGAYVNLVVQSYQPSAVEFFYDPTMPSPTRRFTWGGRTERSWAGTCSRRWSQCARARTRRSSFQRPPRFRQVSRGKSHPRQ